MSSKRRQFLLLCLLLLCLPACDQFRPDPPHVPTVQPEQGPVAMPVISTASPTPTAVPPTITPSPTTTPQPTATATATATPIPEVAVAVPAGWESWLQPALAEVQSDNWRWRVQGMDEPAVAPATLALVPGTEGEPAGQRPLAITIPWTINWEETSLAQAQEIISNGHSLAQVMLWDEVRPPLKALRVDGLHPADPDYPFQQPYVLQAPAGLEAAATFLAAHLAPLVSQERTVELAAAGDIMLDRTLGRAISNGQIDYPFLNVAPIFQAADVAVGNLECALGDVGEPANKSYTFRAPPAAAQSLANAGFDVVSLANNHGMDYGPEALLQGLELLREQNVLPVGAGRDATEARSPAFVDADGMRLAFLGYVHVPVEGRSPFFDTQTWTATADTPGLAWAVLEEIAADVAAAKQQADHVIVVLHSGYEYVPPPSDPQRFAAWAAIDAGATMVIGHHAHILQGVEFYNGGVIVYGLGNFAFTIDGDPETAILRAWLDHEGVRQIEFIPAIIQTGGQPRLATAWEAPDILQTIYRLSAPLNVRSSP